MKKTCCKRKSLIKKLLLSIFIILAVSSFSAVLLITNILPFSSTLFAEISDYSRTAAMRVLRSYLFYSSAFAFILSAIFITLITNRTLKPVSALTDGTYREIGRASCRERV